LYAKVILANLNYFLFVNDVLLSSFRAVTCKFGGFDRVAKYNVYLSQRQMTTTDTENSDIPNTKSIIRSS